MTSLQNDKLKSQIRFFVLPTQAQVYTLTKAPIAHKSNSKEQYKFVFYLLRVSFTNCTFTDGTIFSVSQGLVFLLNAKKSIPFFSSNLMTLKNSFVKTQLTDLNFFCS